MGEAVPARRLHRNVQQGTVLLQRLASNLSLELAVVAVLRVQSHSGDPVRDDGRRQLEGYRAELEFRTLLASIRDYFQRGPNLDRKLLMALQASVQKLIDEVAETRDLKDAIKSGFDLMSKQISDLKAQLDAIVPGQPVDAENAAAIQKAVDDLDQTNEALKTAVPAQPAPVPVEGQPLTTGTQPVTHDQAGNPIAPDADGQPKPAEG